MIEAVVIAMILSSVTLRAIGNAAVDVSFAVRGKESPRYKQAKTRSWSPSKPSGPMFKYMSQLWSDSWKQRLEKHNAKVAGGRVEKPRGAARIFWAGLGQDARRAVLRQWDRGWTGLDEMRRAKATRVPDGTQVVPGEVVPDAPVPADPESRPTDTPEAGTGPTASTGPADTAGTRYCTGCGAAVVIDGDLCGACQYRGAQDATPPSTTPDPTPVPAEPTPPPTDIHPADRRIEDTPQEGTTMTAAATEVSGLSSILTFAEQGAHQFRANVTVAEGRGASCRQDATAYKQMVTATELAVSAAQAGGVSGEAVVRMAQSMEKAAAAAAAMEQAEAQFAIAQEQADAAAADLDASASAFRQHLGIQEQYNANRGAGTREFITAGQ